MSLIMVRNNYIKAKLKLISFVTVNSSGRLDGMPTSFDMSHITWLTPAFYQLKQSSNFLQAHALLNLHIIHSSQSSSGAQEAANTAQAANTGNPEILHPTGRLRGKRTESDGMWTDRKVEIGRFLRR